MSPGTGLVPFWESATLGLIPGDDFYGTVMIYDNERAFSAHVLEAVIKHSLLTGPSFHCPPTWNRYFQNEYFIPRLSEDNDYAFSLDVFIS